MSERGSEKKPFYQVFEQGGSGATQMYMITCDEGWRTSIVCCDMYPWAARWLCDLIQGKPFAPGTRP